MANPAMKNLKRRIRKVQRAVSSTVGGAVANRLEDPAPIALDELAAAPDVDAAPQPPTSREEAAAEATTQDPAPTTEPPTGQTARRPVRPPSNPEQVRLWTLLDEAQSQPLDELGILWESFHGKGMLCHPAAMFRAMVDEPDYAAYHHVWALNMSQDYPDVVAEFADHPRVRFVDVYSDDYYLVLSTAKYLVNNTSFPPVFTKREDQVFMNTWHGTPLKTLGFDMANGAFESKNVLRNLLIADFLLSSGPFMTDQMYRRAYRLEPIYAGRILEVGSPRVDVQLAAGRLPAVRARMAAKGLELGRPTTVVYAPTWKGRSAYRAGGDADELLEIVHHLKSRPELQDADVLLRVHSLVYRGLRRDRRLAPYLVPDTIETNELLAVTDVLITDYSSVFFDFLANDRPIVFHIPDLDTYRADRGYYLEPETWPGRLTRTVTELGDAVVAGLDEHSSRTGDAELAARRAEWRTRFTPDEDGAAARRAVDHLLGHGPAEDRSISVADRQRERLLVYAGPFLPNGITSAALNLFRQLDYTRYDVTVVFQWGSQQEKYAQIDPRVRQIIWQNPMPLTADQTEERAHFLQTGYDAEQVDIATIDAVFRRDWRRTFGLAQFDHVVNFEGYTVFWSAFLLAGDVPRRSIWQHNDLDWDRQKVVAGKRPHETMLAAQFSTYDRFDSVVSVSADLMRVNRSKLHPHAPVASFTYVHNMVDADSIGERAFGAHVSELTARSDVYFEPSVPDQRPTGLDAADTFDRLFRTYRRHDLQLEMRRRVTVDRWCSRSAKAYQFVSVGRLSPEKNHTLLLDAFALVLEEVPTARLVLVGDGPLRKDLEGQIRKLAIGRAAKVTGYLEHGLAVMANSDCLVMSSLYEGLPMAILEAKYLGLPVVATDFGTIGSALADGEGIVTQMTSRSLAEGMMAAIQGKAVAGAFDADLWNARALEQFDRLVARSAGDA